MLLFCRLLIFFCFLNTNYFNSINDSAPFLHFWSISLEIQFYLSAPFIILGALRSKAPKFLIFTLIIMSLILSSIYMYRNDAASFYLLPMRLWEFLIGGLVFLLNKKDFSGLSTNNNYNCSKLFFYSDHFSDVNKCIK